jgi:hypothetical protein
LQAIGAAKPLRVEGVPDIYVGDVQSPCAHHGNLLTHAIKRGFKNFQCPAVALAVITKQISCLSAEADKTYHPITIRWFYFYLVTRDENPTRVFPLSLKQV